MRIDDENKVVWCSEPEFEWYVSFNLSKGNYMVCDFKRIAHLSTGNEIIMKSQADLNTRMKLISAITEGYEFKVEEQKYYWRKKKEHLAWFENVDESYLIRFKFSGSSTYEYALGELASVPVLLKENEANALLQADFDKFEKVEIE